MTRKKGRSEWTTDSSYRTIDENYPYATLQTKTGGFCSSYYRSYKKFVMKINLE